MSLLLACAGAIGGCTELWQPRVPPLPGSAGVNRRTQLWDTTGRPTAAPQVSTSQPADGGTVQTPSHRLNSRSIVQLTYEQSPLVRSSREAMIAAKFGLEEFRTNLSRLEPFVEAKADRSKFPERRDSKGFNGELTGGIEKETFEGAIIRFEGGISSSRYEYGEVEEDQEHVDDGSGTVVRGRIEVPFVGSRKRQSRIISQAYQESSAREAMLDYLSNYRTYVENALLYYEQALLYLHYMQAYEQKLVFLEEMLSHPKLRPEDRRRIESFVGDAVVLKDQYQANHWSSLLSLLQYLGIQPDQEYILEEDLHDESPYLEPASDADGIQQLLAQAYENNPRFGVLNDAIKDSELKRSQAILGTYDITAFVEGTHYPFGSVSFDDRLDGWQVEAGLTVRLNDNRVLTASLKKAEAEIRDFQSQIEAEQAEVQREIATQSTRLVSYYESRPQILENIRKDETQFRQRFESYFDTPSSPLTVDDVLTPLHSATSSYVQLAANRYNGARAENALRSATGEVYRQVGLRLRDNGHGAELTESQWASADDVEP